MSMPKLSTAIALLAATAFSAPAFAQGVTGKRATGKSTVDYANAVPLELPRNAAGPAAQDAADQKPVNLGRAGFELGGEGDGAEDKAKTIPANRALQEREEPPSPPEFGTGGTPYTTALQDNPSIDPYRRAGKLFFKKADGGSYICSASLIKTGVIATAAHCVFKFGANALSGFYSNFKFVPAYKNGAAPFGEWDWEYVSIPTPYFNGKDKCAKGAKGVVCANDVALIVLRNQDGTYPGKRTGWFGYAWGGYSYTNKNLVHITQLGYPGAINNGQEMIRTDSQGAVVKAEANNTVIGSQQTGGSSGGPWLANFGPATSPGSGASVGKDGKRNVVVGTTSWGYTSLDPKMQGASPFTTANIRELVKDVCGRHPAAC